MATVPQNIRQEVYNDAFNELNEDDQNILLRLERTRNLNRIRAKRFRENNKDEVNERQRNRRRTDKEQIENVLMDYNKRRRQA